MDSSTSESPHAGALPTDVHAVAACVDRLTRERDAAFAAAEAERDRVTCAMQQCEHLALEILAWRKRHAQQTEQVVLRTAQLAQLSAKLTWQTEQLAQQVEQLAELSHRLAHAAATIRNMERSWFWRARTLWVRARRLVTGTARD